MLHVELVSKTKTLGWKRGVSIQTSHLDTLATKKYGCNFGTRMYSTLDVGAPVRWCFQNLIDKGETRSLFRQICSRDALDPTMFGPVRRFGRIPSNYLQQLPRFYK